MPARPRQGHFRLGLGRDSETEQRHTRKETGNPRVQDSPPIRPGSDTGDQYGAWQLDCQVKGRLWEGSR